MFSGELANKKHADMFDQFWYLAFWHFGILAFGVWYDDDDDDDDDINFR